MTQAPDRAPTASGSGAKAYYIVEIAIHDPETYRAYPAQVEPLIKRFGGRYLVRGGEAVSLEGSAATGRMIVLEFPSLQAAQQFASCDEYKPVAEIRHRSATSRIMLVEGYPA